MTSKQIRQSFFDFFQSKNHLIVASAPIVLKDDPSLMFTNAGMNQFKDVFLGNSPIINPRIADSQKCLRVSGKHNDLEEVGVDSYHHTMFEMLGNWSFGDYYKKDAIDWAWELLTGVFKIAPEKLYVTYFEGDKKDNLSKDEEARNLWGKYLPSEQIIAGNKADNFWEMGETGPCGPCSEIHIDIRSTAEKKKTPGASLVNKDHPQVIEIWNLVFMELNRMANGSLDSLPKKHIDTGMGFERLVMVLQNKKSNYDTDVFQPIIKKLEAISELTYENGNEKDDIAFRVIADHIRAITFAIADGQLPSNVGAGYVIRRILRRAMRYGFQFLLIKEPFLYKLVDGLVKQMGNIFDNLPRQAGLVKNVLLEEEKSFLRTIEQGIKKINIYLKNEPDIIDGAFAFELYDTYGFPFDLTSLIAREFDYAIDEEGFLILLEEQKKRSRSHGKIETGDWIHVLDDDIEEFIGYDFTDGNVKITRYREIMEKKKKKYQLVFNFTPFYPEGGGQVGDTGYIFFNEERIKIIDTKKENNVIIHITEQLPKNIKITFKAVVDTTAREASACNHTATHLLHHALKKVLGNHVEQKGSLVSPSHLRFDFSHYAGLSKEEIDLVEKEVNEKIRQNIALDEMRGIPMRKALNMGATALFGEKYGDIVRVIKFGDSIELCGGTHVPGTSLIGRFKITSESAIASGIRRIEAVTSHAADEIINTSINEYDETRLLLKVKHKDPIAPLVSNLIDENKNLKKEIEQLNKYRIKLVKLELTNKISEQNGFKILKARCDLTMGLVKDLANQLRNENENLFIVLGVVDNNKPGLTIAANEKLVKNHKVNAGKIIREAAKNIRGGGGGQAFLAQAGGNYTEGLDKALDQSVDLFIECIENQD